LADNFLMLGINVEYRFNPNFAVEADIILTAWIRILWIEVLHVTEFTWAPAPPTELIK